MNIRHLTFIHKIKCSLSSIKPGDRLWPKVVLWSASDSSETIHGKRYVLNLNDIKNNIGGKRNYYSIAVRQFVTGTQNCY